MSALLWTYELSGIYTSETRRFHLMVMPAAVAGVFRFQVMQQIAEPSTYMTLTSGHRALLQEALDAAEQAAAMLETIH